MLNLLANIYPQPVPRDSAGRANDVHATALHTSHPTLHHFTTQSFDKSTTQFPAFRIPHAHAQVKIHNDNALSMRTRKILVTRVRTHAVLPST